MQQVLVACEPPENNTEYGNQSSNGSPQWNQTCELPITSPVLYHTAADV